MLKSITSSPQAQKALQVAKNVGPTVVALGATGASFWYVGAVEPVLTYVDSFLSPLIGSLAGNVYAQGAALVAEAGLAVAALRTGTWTVSQVSKVGKLEAENLQLKADIKEAHEAIEQMENEQDEVLAAREKALAAKEQEFAARNKKLETKEKGLLKRENILEKAQEAIKEEKKAIKAERATFNREKATHEQSIKDAQTKNHDAAKNLRTRETELVDKERAVEDLESELEQARLVLEEERAELAAQKAAFERSKQQTTKAIPAPLSELAPGIQVRPSILSDFNRRRELERQHRSTAAISLPVSVKVQQAAVEEGELSSASSSDDNSDRRSRSPSPTGLH